MIGGTCQGRGREQSRQADPQRHHRTNRALIWITRPGVEDSVIVPNWAVLTKRFGVPRFTLFKPLKASKRTWNRPCSLTRKPRLIAKASVCIPGPDTVLRPAFPAV